MSKDNMQSRQTSFVDSDGKKQNLPARLRTQRKSIAMIAFQAETIRERQARGKEARDIRRMGLTPAHKYIIEILAQNTDFDAQAVEEFVLDSAKHMELFSRFLDKNNLRVLMFFVQEIEPPGFDSGRSLGLPKGTKMQGIIVTDGTCEALTGRCLYFIKSDVASAINPRNVHEMVNFGNFSCANAGTLTVLPAIQQLLMKVHNPAAHALDDWGALSETPIGKKTRQNFLDSFDTFIDFINGAKTSISGAVKLHGCDGFDVTSLATPGDCLSAAANPDSVAILEDLVHHWCKEIEQVLTESEQMRKEADDTGPLAELEHWRLLMARFNSIMDQIKSKHCKMVISTLNAAKSKVLKVQLCSDPFPAIGTHGATLVIQHGWVFSPTQRF
ncbi:dynein axonemal heavy chain 8-like [Antedon mediterranea]|uniref:dynein axonemal heavy chain 8-like n=1 Tax=Antedon mediterranea TaxID=105859 RepID=UPI003AF59F14